MEESWTVRQEVSLLRAQISTAAALGSSPARALPCTKPSALFQPCSSKLENQLGRGLGHRL